MERRALIIFQVDESRLVERAWGGLLLYYAADDGALAGKSKPNRAVFGCYRNRGGGRFCAFYVTQSDSPKKLSQMF